MADEIWIVHTWGWTVGGKSRREEYGTADAAQAAYRIAQADRAAWSAEIGMCPSVRHTYRRVSSFVRDPSENPNV